MRALLCTSFESGNSLAFEELELPAPAAGQILVQVKACGINFPDLLLLQNKYQFKPPLPFSPGGEVAGIIKAIGDGVKRFQVGDRVVSLCKWGGLAEEVLVDVESCFYLPDTLDFIAGASFFYNYATSYHALKNRAMLRNGEWILVLGAGSGVGLAAVALGKWMGAKVIAAASSEEKLALASAAGAFECINYASEDLRDRIHAITNQKGVQVVFDPVGGKFTEPALREMAWGGRYLMVGFATGQVPQISLNLPLLKGCSVIGVFLSRFSKENPQLFKSNLSELQQLITDHQIGLPPVRVYPFERAKEALDDLSQRKVAGKAVVLTGSLFEASQKSQSSDISKEELQPLIFSNKEQVFEAIGTELGVSEWFRVSQSVIDDFAHSTLDKQWIHTDTLKAARTVFGSTIAHGYLTLSLLPKLLESVYTCSFSAMGINYGAEKIRFLNPVKAGSRIRVRAFLKYASELTGGGIKMILACTIEIEGEEKPACYAEIISVLYG